MPDTIFGEGDLESRLEKTRALLSAITRQPIALWEMKPAKFNGKLLDKLAFEANLHLGDEYNIHLWHILKIDKTIRWGADHCGFEVKDVNGRMLGGKRYGSSESYSKSEISEDANVIDRARLDFLLNSFGGIDVCDIPFMDYESYSLESLKDFNSHDYFSSIYLILMCHLKEQGIELPPILSKREDIRRAMFDGDIATVNSILGIELAGIASDYEKPCLTHAKEEAEEIRRLTLKRGMYHDKTVPLIEKLPNTDVITIPGNNHHKKYNILVVEDFGDYYDHQGTVFRLSKKVADELAKKGNYGGTNVFRTINLAECMNLCGTGQIDAILMDAGYFALSKLEENVRAVGGDFTIFQDHEEKAISQINGYGEKQIWKERIYKVVESNGHIPPPCVIVSNNILNTDVGAFVDRMLKRK